jgi:uncharacterized protein with HEPN domain
MSLSHHDFLRHITDEIDFILTQTENKSQKEVFDDDVLSRAIVRSFEIIGEATKKLHPDFKLLHPDVPWKNMAGTRDRLIHH